MANNVNVTEGSGKIIASDEVSSVNYQKIKLVDGTAGSTALIAGDATYGLDVDITRLPSGTVAGGSSLPAGTNNIGDVDILSIAAGDNNIGNVDIVTLPALPAGTNNIGDVDILSIAAGDNNIGNVDIASIAAGDNNIGNVDIVTAPARARTTDTISSADATDAVMNGTTACTPKFAVIDAASSGDNTLVAAVTAKKIRVLSLVLVSAGTVNVRFESGAGGTALTGQMNLVANTGFSLPYNPVGWFETASNTLLNLELSGAISVDGCLTYIEV